MYKVLKEKKSSSASIELQIKLFKGFLLIVQGSLLVNLIPTLWDKTFPMGHCSVTLDVCSVLTLFKLWGVPSALVKAPLCGHRWVLSPAGLSVTVTIGRTAILHHWLFPLQLYPVPAVLHSLGVDNALEKEEILVRQKGLKNLPRLLGVVSWEERERKKN